MFKDMKKRELERKQKDRINELINNGLDKKAASGQAKQEWPRSGLPPEIRYAFVGLDS